MSRVLVTGGNSGIGFECALRLARAGARVVIASRNREASAEAAARIAAETGEESIEAMEIDLASLESVRRFAKEVESRNLPLAGLVCNAGLQVNRGPVLSPDGVEVTFAANHLGHFLLTNLLLRRLLAHGPARVVVVSSGVHDPAIFTGMPDPDIPRVECLASGGPEGRGFDGRLAYVNSKLCNLWFTYELIRRLEAAAPDGGPLSVNAFEPGLVPGSALVRDYPAPLRLFWNHVLPVLSHVVTSINSLEVSGGALAEVVLDPELERVSGRYFPSHSRFREAPSSDTSYDEEQARRLWEESVRLTSLTPEESPLA